MKKFLSTGTLLILLSGCMMYFPMTVDIPLIEEKDDLKVSGGFSSVGFAHGTISYGLTDRVAVQAFANVDFLTRFYLQGAVGLYRWFEESLTGTELYVGYGHGNSISNFNNTEGPTGHYHLVFSQFNVGRVEMGASNIDLALGLKGGYLLSNFVDRSYYRPEIMKKDRGLIIEPSVLFRFETNRSRRVWRGTIREMIFPLDNNGVVKYSIQFNYAFPVTISRDALFSPINFSIGRQF